MGERLTLKQIGEASTVFDNQPNRFPELNANFELKSGLPGEDPIKLIKDFEVICANTRRTGGDEDAAKAFALPFSLDDRGKDWYYSLPAENSTVFAKSLVDIVARSQQNSSKSGVIGKNSPW
ncbi:hypothetical protein PIB30_083745 [Stylosanthes scabra]|uniref:Uncharacterized protein n=1 Tax=Stylosanthes scabra TaxID=79078 RepID=A0ABU6RSJ1_9FABA|nr:hypothetical protein [Stylosanthes scabra]